MRKTRSDNLKVKSLQKFELCVQARLRIVQLNLHDMFVNTGVVLQLQHWAKLLLNSKMFKTRLNKLFLI